MTWAHVLAFFVGLAAGLVIAAVDDHRRRRQEASKAVRRLQRQDAIDNVRVVERWPPGR